MPFILDKNEYRYLPCRKSSHIYAKSFINIPYWLAQIKLLLDRINLEWVPNEMNLHAVNSLQIHK